VWDEIHDRYGRTRSDSEKQLAINGVKVLGMPLSPRYGRVRDSLRDLQRYRGLARALAIPDVVPKSMAIEATVRNVGRIDCV
jgi:hypothetical protein